jgi:hypothetical protein
MKLWHGKDMWRNTSHHWDISFARALSQFSQYCPRSIHFSFSSWYSMWGWSYTLWLLVILRPQSRRFRQELRSFQFCESCLGTVIISSRPGILPSAVLVKGSRERLRMDSWIFSVKTVLIHSPNMETQVQQRLIQPNKKAASWKHVRLCPQLSHGITNDIYD